jgi:prostatic aicd phosphatase
MAYSILQGVVVIARHGDRLGFYQDPTTYAASGTSITALGTVQEYNLGSLISSIYLDQSSPLAIDGISPIKVNASQLKVRADAGDEGYVIFDSSVALLQGLYPPTNLSTSTQSNGSVVESPLGGYQYIPSKLLATFSHQLVCDPNCLVESVQLNEDVSLEGHADCTVSNLIVKRLFMSSNIHNRRGVTEYPISITPPFSPQLPMRVTLKTSSLRSNQLLVLKGRSACLTR